MSDKAVRHTELPWKAKKRDHGYENEIFDLVSQNGTPVFMGTIYGDSRANAEFAEKALKNHYKLVEALEALLRYAERNTCLHEDTSRGGIIWEICEACGMKWADDDGGKPEFKWPAEVDKARQALAEVK